MHGPPKLHPTLTSFTALTHSLLPVPHPQTGTYCLPCPTWIQWNRKTEAANHHSTTHPRLRRSPISLRQDTEDRHTLILLNIGRILFCHCTTTQRQHGSTPLSLPAHARPPPHHRPSCRDIDCVTGSPAVSQPSSGPVAATPSPVLGSSCGPWWAHWLVVVGSCSPDTRYPLLTYPINSHCSPIAIPHHPLQFTVVAFGLLCLALLRIVACLGLESGPGQFRDR